MSGGVEEIGQSMVAPGLRMITSGLSFSNEQGDAGITGRRGYNGSRNSSRDGNGQVWYA
jgi:hypothetical protein